MNRILARRARQLLGRLAPHLPREGRLLDVGSGTGHNAAAIEDATRLQVTEMDVTDLNTKGRQLVLFDGQNIPFGNSDFDAVLLLYVLHYAADPMGLVQELGRVARTRVIIMQSVYYGPIGRVVLWLRDWIQGRLAFRVAARLGLVPRGPCPMQPMRYYTRKELAAVFQKANLRILTRSDSPWPCLGLSRDLYVLERKRT